MATVVPSLRSEFPALGQAIGGEPLHYLDNAATTQRPERVLAAMDDFYRHHNANVHRGVHTLSRRATDLFEEARRRVARYVGVQDDAEIIFTKGCTEAINLVAHSWGRANLRPGDQILLSTLEHHANIVPWQLVAQATGAEVVPIPIHDTCEIDLDAYRALLSPRVRLVGVKHVCNATGTINPIAEMARAAHEVGALVMVDGAQGLAHESTDIPALGADFYSISGHKVYGPMGIGALVSRRELLEAMPPYQGGGDMIRIVRFEGTTFNDIPNRFEAGTPNVPAAIGLGEALEFMREVGVSAIAEHENRLAREAERRLAALPGLRIVGQAARKAAIVSFTVEGIHPHDVGTILDSVGVAVRTGHHCCQPLMHRLGLPATIRASFAPYNAEADVEALIAGIHRAREIFA